MRDDFAVFILTHGRPDNLITLKTLEKDGYTGKIFLIIDNEDKKQEEYIEKYGNKVVVFDKEQAFKEFDVGDTFKDRRAVVAARNKAFDIAKDLGLTYFLELDDDYTSFLYRYTDGDKLRWKECKNLDQLFTYFIDFLEESGALTITFAQGGDFIGGVKNAYKKKILRKAMNTFFCKVDRRFDFIGRINEDTNAYSVLNQTGNIMLTITDVMVNQLQTQSNIGGLTDIYLNFGTYVKSFYSVMMAPSCVKVAMMGEAHKRLHHRVNWKNCAPKIINEKHKKI